MIPTSTAVPGGFTFSANWRGFELKQDSQTVATLRRPSMWSCHYIAATPSESWIIRRSGFWGNKAEIVDPASKQAIATFKSSWGGRGLLAFADGQMFLSSNRGCWHPVWSVTTETGQPVLRLHKRERLVEVESASPVPQDRMRLLILFTLYRVRQAEEAAAGGAVAAVAAAS